MDARRTRRGDNGLLYTLVLFVFLFFIAAAFAVVYYMQNQDHIAAREGAESDLASFVRPADRSSDEFQRLQARVQDENRSSVFEVIRHELQSLRSLIAGQADADLEAITAQLQQYGIGDDDVILHVFQDMTRDLERLQDDLQAATAELQATEERLTDMQDQASVEQAAYQSQIEELSARVEELNADYIGFREQVDQQRDELGRRLNQARDEAEEEIRNRDQQISRLEGELSEREARIRQLIQEIGGETPDAPDATRQPDGRIVEVDQNRNMAYIDLGRRDHIVHGMRFEVYDRIRGVEVDASGELRGKATIEIVDISERSSAGRVIRSSVGQPVLSGDLIANAIYDRDRQFKFFVWGDFDLEGDGNYSSGDRQVIETLIRRWGGVVVDVDDRTNQLGARFGDDMAEARIVPPDVDFVIIGREPRLPTQSPGGDEDAVRIQEAIQAEEAWERYHQIAEAASALTIPVLNQNRFLALIGHTADRN